MGIILIYKKPLYDSLSIITVLKPGIFAFKKKKKYEIGHLLFLFLVIDYLNLNITILA